MNEIDFFEIENILIYMVWTWWIYVVGIYLLSPSLSIYVLCGYIFLATSIISSCMYYMLASQYL